MSISTSEGPEILRVEGVTKRFGGLAALQGVSFAVRKGEILGIIGPNGAGKTTLFNVLVGLLRPDEGRILFQDEPIQGLPPHEIARRGITKTFQTTVLFDDMPVLDNVVVGALLRCRRVSEAVVRARAALEAVGLDPELRSTPAELNLVDRARLEVARALATQPQLLLLDEVMAGLTPAETAEAVAMLRRLRDTGITLVVVEHNMRAIMRLSDRVLALDHGMKIAEGSPEAVSSDPLVIECYLGRGYQVAAG